MALVLKNIGLANESVWGTGVSPTYYPRVVSAGLNLDLNKTMVKDTAGTRKGFGRIVNIGRTVAGDIGGYAYSDDFGFWLKGVLGGTVVSSALASGFQHTFSQMAAGNDLPSYTIEADKGEEVVRWTGVRVNTLSLTSANEMVEFTAGMLAKDEATSSIYTVSADQTLDPFTFNQVSIRIGNTLALASGADATPMDSWNLTYDNQSEQRFQSGSTGASRIDPLIAMLTGSFTKFYEDTNFNTWRTGGTEKALLIEATGATIGGTNHKLTIRIPRVEIMTSERPYEAGNLIVETADWEAMYDSTYGYMVEAELTNLKTDYTS